MNEYNQNNVISNNSNDLDGTLYQQINNVNDNSVKNKKAIIFIILLFVFLLVGILCFFIYQKKFIHKNDNKEVQNKIVEQDVETEEELIPIKEYKNIIGAKNQINTTLDLKSIFGDDVLYDEEPLKDYNIRKIIFNNDKAYFSYSPYPSGFQMLACNNIDEKITTCDNNGEVDCKIKYAYLCPNVYKNSGILKDMYPLENKTEDDLNYRYLLSSNIDGSNLKELDSYMPAGEIVSFEYINDNNVYF